MNKEQKKIYKFKQSTVFDKGQMEHEMIELMDSDYTHVLFETGFEETSIKKGLFFLWNMNNSLSLLDLPEKKQNKIWQDVIEIKREQSFQFRNYYTHILGLIMYSKLEVALMNLMAFKNYEINSSKEIVKTSFYQSFVDTFNSLEQVFGKQWSNNFFITLQKNEFRDVENFLLSLLSSDEECRNDLYSRISNEGIYFDFKNKLILNQEYRLLKKSEKSNEINGSNSELGLNKQTKFKIVKL